MVDRTGTEAPNGTRADEARPPFRDERFRDAITRLWRVVVTRFPQIRADVGAYLATYVDSARAAGASAVETAIKLAVLAVVGLTVVVTATVLLLVGLASGLAGLLEIPGWLADAAVGGGALALLTLAIVLMQRSGRRRRVRALEQRYERQDAARPLDRSVTP